MTSSFFAIRTRCNPCQATAGRRANHDRMRNRREIFVTHRDGVGMGAGVEPAGRAAGISAARASRPTVCAENKRLFRRYSPCRQRLHAHQNLFGPRAVHRAPRGRSGLNRGGHAGTRGTPHPHPESSRSHREAGFHDDWRPSTALLRHLHARPGTRVGTGERSYSSATTLALVAHIGSAGDASCASGFSVERHPGCRRAGGQPTGSPWLLRGSFIFLA
jgi:hypothetical protein